MSKHYTLSNNGMDYDVTLNVATYCNPMGLCLNLINHSNNYPEPYTRITVNVDESIDTIDKYNTGLIAAIDEPNNPNIIDFIESNNLGHFIGKIVILNYGLYPVYRFNENALRESAHKSFEEHMKRIDEYKKHKNFINN